ncbi:hypothetical protein BJ138DRAFT_1012447 [Hygrophoropsis aurantiaca]|uniref:Uncharacterized protein n=1 Tax=Hygrophoropsis aurantiaca TaxID=72124 RepID=A0ACB8A681_9AGAM|nr:hypothetical protein BJ138DRAFT_1012447 [Hygrophoropsis aurantiaca]
MSGIIQFGANDISHQADFIKTAKDKLKNNLDSEQIANTLHILLEYQSPSSDAGASFISFSPSDLLVLGRGSTPPDEQTRKKLLNLTEAAQDAAKSLFCGSIIAGHTSESDEYADIGIWLGHGPDDHGYDKGYEIEVLHALGLDATIDEIQSVQLDPTSYLPQVIVTKSTSPPAVEAFSSALKDLTNVHCFFATFEHESSMMMVWFLLGKLLPDGWCGLVGMGVSSDE